MAQHAGAYIVPTMQMTQEDMQSLRTGTLAAQAVWKFQRDNEHILASQRLPAASGVKVAYATDCGISCVGQSDPQFITNPTGQMKGS